MSVKIQLKRSTAAAWTAANPTLSSGEIGYETDTAKFKIGNGSTAWTSLGYSNANLGSASLDALSDVTITSAANGDFLRWNGTSWINDAVNLSTDTVGSYVESLVAGTGVTLSNNSGEAATPTVAIGQDVTPSATPTFAGLNINGSIFFEGATANEFETTLSVIDPTADRVVSLPDATTTLVGTDTTQTLSNKTLTTPTINGPEITATGGTPRIHGIYLPEPHFITFEGSTTDEFETILTVVNPTADRTVSLPDATTTLVGKDTTDTLTNKTLTSPKINEDVVLTASATELNILDGATLSTTELNYVDGVTSAIQTQIDSKAPSASPTFTGVVTLPDNTVALGTKTTGDYVASLVAGTGVTLTNNSGETATPTVAIGQAVGTSASVTFANITATGTVTLAADPSSALQAVTKQYVDNVVSGVNFHASVVSATSGNLAGTYNNGTAGVGATLTKATNGSIGTIDGASVVVGNRILVKSQTDSKENGIYTITAVGSVSAPWVLTRATDADNSISGEMANGDFCFVMGGNTNAGYGFINNSPTNPIVLGTDNVTYTEFNAAQTITAGTGLALTSNVMSLNATLDDLSNVTASAPSDGQFLKYVSASSAWVAASVPTINALDDIGDVSASAPSSGQFLKWNGTAWVADSIPTINALDDIGNVTAPSPTTGEVLLWNGTAWVDSNVVRDNLVRFYMEVM